MESSVANISCFIPFTAVNACDVQKNVTCVSEVSNVVMGKLFNMMQRLLLKCNLVIKKKNSPAVWPPRKLLGKTDVQFKVAFKKRP